MCACSLKNWISLLIKLSCLISLESSTNLNWTIIRNLEALDSYFILEWIFLAVCTNDPSRGPRTQDLDRFMNSMKFNNFHKLILIINLIFIGLFFLNFEKKHQVVYNKIRCLEFWHIIMGNLFLWTYTISTNGKLFN